jgi:hypothetical protein
MIEGKKVKGPLSQAGLLLSSVFLSFLLTS